MQKDVHKKRLRKPLKAPVGKLPIRLTNKASQLSMKEVNGSTEEKKDSLKYDVGQEEHEDPLIEEVMVLCFQYLSF